MRIRDWRKWRMPAWSRSKILDFAFGPWISKRRISISSAGGETPLSLRQADLLRLGRWKKIGSQSVLRFELLGDPHSMSNAKHSGSRLARVGVARAFITRKPIVCCFHTRVLYADLSNLSKDWMDEMYKNWQQRIAYLLKTVHLNQRQAGGLTGQPKQYFGDYQIEHRIEGRRISHPSTQRCEHCLDLYQIG